MIDEARKRAIYTDFIVDDFESALAGLDRSYDLAIGADALIGMAYVRIAVRIIDCGCEIETRHAG